MINFISGNKFMISKFLCTKCLPDNNLVKSFSSGLEQIVDVKGHIINYLKVGKGEKNVLCFPGALGTIWSDFRPQIEGLDREKLTVIAWDPPGYGSSQPPVRTFGTNFYEKDAETAYEFMMKLGIKKFSLLGRNDGGISSLILAGRHPECVEKLIIWGARAYILEEDMDKHEKFRDTSGWPLEMKAPFIELYTARGLAKMWGAWYDSITDIFNTGGDICSCCLKNIKCPTLILYGDKDPMVSVAHPHYLYSSIKNAKLYRFAMGEHNIHVQYPEEFNRIVTDFLFSRYCRRR